MEAGKRKIRHENANKVFARPTLSWSHWLRPSSPSGLSFDLNGLGSFAKRRMSREMHRNAVGQAAGSKIPRWVQEHHWSRYPEDSIPHCIDKAKPGSKQKEECFVSFHFCHLHWCHSISDCIFYLRIFLCGYWFIFGVLRTCSPNTRDSAVTVAQTRVGFLTGGCKEGFRALPQEDQCVQLEAYGRATHVQGLLRAATVLGSLMYGAGHVHRGHANFDLHDDTLQGSVTDSEFAELLARNCCLRAPDFPHSQNIPLRCRRFVKGYALDHSEFPCGCVHIQVSLKYIVEATLQSKLQRWPIFSCTSWSNPSATRCSAKARAATFSLVTTMSLRSGSKTKSPARSTAADRVLPAPKTPLISLP